MRVKVDQLRVREFARTIVRGQTRFYYLGAFTRWFMLIRCVTNQHNNMLSGSARGKEKFT